MLSVITIEESDKWDYIVKSFKNYDIYYLSDYTKAFRIHGDGEPILFYYEDHNIKAMNVVMKRDISLDNNFLGKIPANTYFDLITPYGYGGFLVEGKDSTSLDNLEFEYSSLCKKTGIISEFVRFHPLLKNSDIMESVYEISKLGKTISIMLESKEQIWSDLTPKNRNVIRKAKKSGVEIYWGRNEKLFESFIEMYNTTMDRDNAKNYYYFKEDFYNSVLKDLKFNSMIFYATYKGKIISMSIVMHSNQKMHYHLSASDRNYQNFAPTNLLLYEAACWGYENGYKTFHLGGGLGSKEDNLFKFKKAFNRNSDYTFAIGKKIFDGEKYKKLHSIREFDFTYEKNISFFPTYRS